ncbi:hypothetical protein [Rhodohalobacter sp. SW132]|nr:hypothetical protein [Rhodohalobacter sp. SW132]
MNPKSTKMRMDSDKKHEFEYYFKNPKLTDDENDDDKEEPRDVDIRHPDQ